MSLDSDKMGINIAHLNNYNNIVVAWELGR